MDKVLLFYKIILLKKDDLKLNIFLIVTEN